MIKTDRQRSTTLSRIADLEQAATIAEASHPEGEQDHERRAHFIRGLRSNVASLRREIREYDALKSGDESIIKIKNVFDLLKALAKYRILRGWTQERLANELGVKKQQVQRWEQFEYQTAAAHVVATIAELLGINLEHGNRRIDTGAMHADQSSWRYVDAALAAFERGNAVAHVQHVSHQQQWPNVLRSPDTKIWLQSKLSSPVLNHALAVGDITEEGEAPGALLNPYRSMYYQLLLRQMLDQPLNTMSQCMQPVTSDGILLGTVERQTIAGESGRFLRLAQEQDIDVELDQ